MYLDNHVHSSQGISARTSKDLNRQKERERERKEKKVKKVQEKKTPNQDLEKKTKIRANVRWMQYVGTLTGINCGRKRKIKTALCRLS